MRTKIDVIEDIFVIASLAWFVEWSICSAIDLRRFSRTSQPTDNRCHNFLHKPIWRYDWNAHEFRFSLYATKANVRSIDFIICLFRVWFARGRRQPRWMTKDELNDSRKKSSDAGRCANWIGRMGRIDRMYANHAFSLFPFDVTIFHENGAHIFRDAYSEHFLRPSAISRMMPFFIASNALLSSLERSKAKPNAVCHMWVLPWLVRRPAKNPVWHLLVKRSALLKPDQMRFAVRLKHFSQRHRAPNCSEAIVFQFGSRLFIINACIERN